MPAAPAIPARSVILGTLVLLTAQASGDVITVSDIRLDGFQPVPPTGSLATGLASMTIDTDTRDITISGVFSGLEGPITMAHLHGPADIGQSSPLIFTFLTIETDDGFSGSFSAEDRVSSFQLNALLDSRTYLNVHTGAHPDGEIRGQVGVPAPGSAALLACLALGAAHRRR